MSVFFKAYFLISFFIIAVPVEATQSLTNMDLTNMDLKSLITESERRSSRFENFALLEKIIAPHFLEEYLTEVYSIVTINMELSRRYFYGIGVPQNKSEFAAYSVAADIVAENYFSKAPSTTSSKNKIEEVVTKKMQEMISSIKQSQNIGKYYMSMMFLKGFGTESFSSEGLYDLENLADRGYKPVQILQGIGTESFSSEGLYYLENLADRGYKPAQILLTKIFFYGLYGIKQNNKEALNWAKMVFEGKKLDEATALKKAASINVELLVLKSATSASSGAKIKLLKLRIFLAAKKEAERRASKQAERQASKKANIALQNGQCRKVFTRK